MATTGIAVIVTYGNQNIRLDVAAECGKAELVDAIKREFPELSDCELKVTYFDTEMDMCLDLTSTTRLFNKARVTVQKAKRAPRGKPRSKEANDYNYRLRQALMQAGLWTGDKGAGDISPSVKDGIVAKVKESSGLRSDREIRHDIMTKLRDLKFQKRKRAGISTPTCTPSTSTATTSRSGSHTPAVVSKRRRISSSDSEDGPPSPPVVVQETPTTTKTKFSPRKRSQRTGEGVPDLDESDDDLMTEESDASSVQLLDSDDVGDHQTASRTGAASTTGAASATGAASTTRAASATGAPSTTRAAIDDTQLGVGSIAAVVYRDNKTQSLEHIATVKVMGIKASTCKCELIQLWVDGGLTDKQLESQYIQFPRETLLGINRFLSKRVSSGNIHAAAMHKNRLYDCRILEQVDEEDVLVVWESKGKKKTEKSSQVGIDSLQLKLSPLY